MAKRSRAGFAGATRPTDARITVGLAVLLAAVVHVTPLAAQSPRPAWRGAWRLSAEAEYDSNVFRLSDTQRSVLQGSPDAGRYQDMSQPSDVVVRTALRGSLRGRGLAARPLEVGGTVRVDAYTSNSRLTHVRLSTFVRQSLTSRDRLSVEFGYRPDEFRRAYLAGTGSSGSPAYSAGIATRSGGRITYQRAVRKGSRHDLDLDVVLEGERRTMAGFAWRDRTAFGGQVTLRAELGRRVDGELTLGRGRGSYDGTPEPFMAGGVVSTTSLERDFGQTELGVGMRFDLRHRRRFLVGWQRRLRDFAAVLGEDPVYGDRRDTRDTFEAELRYDFRGPFELRGGGSYRKQNTFRPARGDTTDEADYRKTRVFLSVRYAR